MRYPARENSAFTSLGLIHGDYTVGQPHCEGLLHHDLPAVNRLSL